MVIWGNRNLTLSLISCKTVISPRVINWQNQLNPNPCSAKRKANFIVFKAIGLIARQGDAAVREALEATLAVLNAHALDIVVDHNCAHLVGPAAGYREAVDDELTLGRDLVIAVGGDGTLLRAAHMTFPRNVPLLGINLGRLGFLTDISPDQVSGSLAAILNGEYLSEERFVLRCEIVRKGEIIAVSHGLNDVVIQRWSTARLITLSTFVDGCFVHSQRSDGMIISTPTGSTAYALSGGGPILHPDLAVNVLVPICPHTLTNRPIVIANTAMIEIDVGMDRADESRVTCDGKPLPAIRSGDRIRITRHDQVVRLIHPAGHDHFSTLRAKLQWGRDPC